MNKNERISKTQETINKSQIKLTDMITLFSDLISTAREIQMSLHSANERLEEAKTKARK